MTDMVNSPAHYKRGGIEVIDVLEAYNLGYCAGNAVKYLLRYQFKGKALEDLKKSQWYVNRLIANMEKEYGRAEGVQDSRDDDHE
jgi:hypothetical protein